MPKRPLRMFKYKTIARMVQEPASRNFYELQLRDKEPWLDAAVQKISESQALQDEFWLYEAPQRNQIVEIIAAKLREKNAAVFICGLAIALDDSGELSILLEQRSGII